MAIQRKQVTIGLLITVILILVGVALYMTLFYTAVPEPERTTQKVKAEGETFNKVVVLNSNEPTNPPSAINPTDVSSSPTPPVGGPTGAQEAALPNATPTEIILAYKNPTVTPGLSGAVSATTGTITPTEAIKSGTPSASITKMKSLPQTGLLTNSLVAVGTALTLIVVSFVF